MGRNFPTYSEEAAVGYDFSLLLSWLGLLFSLFCHHRRRADAHYRVTPLKASNLNRKPKASRPPLRSAPCSISDVSRSAAIHLTCVTR